MPKKKTEEKNLDREPIDSIDKLLEFHEQEKLRGNIEDLNSGETIYTTEEKEKTKKKSTRRKKKYSSQTHNSSNQNLKEKIEDLLTSSKVLSSSEKKKIIDQLEEYYNEEILNYKQSYKLLHANKDFTSTRIRTVKKGEIAIFINLTDDTIFMERIQSFDSTTIRTKHRIFPLGLIKTIAIAKPFYIPMFEEPYKYIHLCIANAHALDLSQKINELVSSEFLKAIITYEQPKGLKDNPYVQIVIGSVVFGLVMYFVLLQVFKKAIVRMIGEFKINT